MKLRLLMAAAFLATAGCRNADMERGDPAGEASQVSPVQKGAIVAADSTVIPDPLNKLFFAVKLVAKEPEEGRYEVLAHYGNNDAAGEVTMPSGGEHLKPLLRKGPEPFQYIVGFRYGQTDTTFYEYYTVRADKGMMEMKYLKAYSIK